MAIQQSSRRLIIAGGIALVVTIAPGVAGPSQNLAGPSTCTVKKSNGSASLVCSPGSVTNAGAPTEQELTASNSARRGGLL